MVAGIIVNNIYIYNYIYVIDYEMMMKVKKKNLVLHVQSELRNLSLKKKRMDFPSDWKEKTLKAIDKVTEHPAAGLFLSPVEAGTDTDGDYYSIVKNPKDFGTIREDIVNNKYKSPFDVISDVELIWRNAALFNGNKSDVTMLAKRCYDMFVKRMRDYSMLPFNLWSTELFRVQTRLNFLLGTLPPKLKQYNPQQSSKDKKGEKEKIVATEREMRNFCEAAALLQSEEEMIEMIRIINDNQPSLNVGSEKVTIDVSQLNVDTFNALMQFMIGALGKKGIAYPNY